jgi:hypothetical protein
LGISKRSKGKRLKGKKRERRAKKKKKMASEDEERGITKMSERK